MVLKVETKAQHVNYLHKKQNWGKVNILGIKIFPAFPSSILQQKTALEVLYVAAKSPNSISTNFDHYQNP